MGYLVKLDSNGSNPMMLEKLLHEKLLDFVAMDVKAPLGRYEAVAGVAIAPEILAQSIALIKNSGVDYEFRTTVVKSLHKIADFDEIGHAISMGSKAKRYALQHFQPAKTLDPKFASDTTFSESDFALLAEKMSAYADEVIVH